MADNMKTMLVQVSRLAHGAPWKAHSVERIIRLHQFSRALSHAKLQEQEILD